MPDPSGGYDAIVETFIAARSAIGAPEVRRWAAALPAGASVLELGCGHGVPITDALLVAGCHVHAVDASPRMVRAFRERFPQVPVTCEAAETSSTLDRGWDGIVAWGLLFLLAPSSQRTVLTRIARAVNPGGRVLVTAPSQACTWNDALTGRASTSLGAVTYRDILASAGLHLDDEFDDEGGNHYYVATRRVPGIGAVSHPIPAWEPLSETVLADQAGTYDRMRAACPVARSPRGVTLFRHADVVAAASDPATFSSAASAHRAVPNTLDPPEHTAFRKAIDAFFTPERMRALEPRLRTIAHRIVSALPRGVTVDAVTDIGYPFAVRAQADWLGWQGIENELLAWMAENHAATRSTDRLRTAAVAAAFDEIVAAQVQRRRAAGSGAPSDPTTDLLHVLVDGKPLSDADIVSILRNWTAGDLGSMAAALGVVVHFLATHPSTQDELRSGTGDMALAIDEMLRIDDPFLVNRRVTTVETHVAGYVLEPGTRVYLNWTSANRDEAVFGEPDAYLPEAHAPHNLVYGTGLHVCPGRPLATLELVVAVQTLLGATRRVELATDTAAVRETYPLGGWRRVPVQLH